MTSKLMKEERGRRKKFQGKKKFFFLADYFIQVFVIRFRYHLIYLTLVLHGIGTLMPWNMFITAKEVCTYVVRCEFIFIALLCLNL